MSSNLFGEPAPGLVTTFWVAFIDLVHDGRTYANLFLLLRRWIAEEKRRGR
ncbi:hypothetical protein ABZ793_21210 [Micromonospora sp. NPDC047465]|uniref:hypothetical protein n=1 Tax=Micromonospora sp. NPDC047465 TaxID=3154813 RepID=UPI0033E5252F